MIYRKVIALSLSFFALSNCTPKPTDAFLTDKLVGVSKGVDAHYSRIISSTKSSSCIVSSKESQSFWATTMSDLKLLQARTEYWPDNSDLAESVSKLATTFDEAKDKEVIASEDPTRLSNGSLWPCLDADEAARTWRLLDTNLSSLIAASKVQTF